MRKQRHVPCASSIGRFGTKKVAEISSEDFYDFTSTRPQTLLDDKGERYISWPANEFHAYVPDDDSPGLLLFSGVEPNLKWKTYCDTIIAIADRYGVELMVTLGSLFNTVPHTRPFPVSSVVSSQQKLGERVQAIGVFSSPVPGAHGDSHRSVGLLQAARS